MQFTGSIWPTAWRCRTDGNRPAGFGSLSGTVMGISCVTKETVLVLLAHVGLCWHTVPFHRSHLDFFKCTSAAATAGWRWEWEWHLSLSHTHRLHPPLPPYQVTMSSRRTVGLPNVEELGNFCNPSYGDCRSNPIVQESARKCIRFVRCTSALHMYVSL